MLVWRRCTGSLLNSSRLVFLHRNHFESGKAVFELNEGSHHDHLVCLDCGKVEEFFDEQIENVSMILPVSAASRSRQVIRLAMAIAPKEDYEHRKSNSLNRKNAADLL